MPGNESVTDNMKSFVGGVALKQAFYNIKTYNAQAISTAVNNHNSDAAHRHLPIAPTAATTAASGLASLNFLTNSSTPEWKTLPLATGYTTNSDDTLATGKAVKTAYDTLNTNKVNIGNSLNYWPQRIPYCGDVDNPGTDGGKSFNVFWFNGESKGTKPFGDGFIITLVWLLANGGNDWVTQLGIDDGEYTFKFRTRKQATTWNAWKTIALT